MCGIAGIVQCKGLPSVTDVERMTGALQHRGPDGTRWWSNPAGKTILGHCRLAIIDLSASAAQPMPYRGRYHIVYNGEIYNYIELRTSLQNKGYTFDTHSDTEVLLATFDCYGIRMLDMLDGMFAFAIWDEQLQSLTAARDRFGEKPFYYCLQQSQSTFLFASEPKAFRAAGVDMSINESALLGFLALNQADPPAGSTQSFYKNIFQLLPGQWMTADCSTSTIQLTFGSYRKPAPRDTPQIDSNSSAVAQFNVLFKDSIIKRLRSDVSIGSSFSGGLDSASIAATIHALNAENGIYSHEAFTASFPGFEKDEARQAATLAVPLGLSCNTITLDVAQFADEIVTVIRHHEEPISSASVFAQYKVFEKAAEAGIKVLLDGQGADELLGGYDQYLHWFLQELIRRGHLRGFIQEKNALQSAGRGTTWGIRNYAAAFFPAWAAHHRTRREKHRILHNTDLSADFMNSNLAGIRMEKPAIKTLNDLLTWSTERYGLKELLRYSDRNAMAHGREVRLPFLQKELAAWLLAIPAGWKVRQGYTKWILRKAMEGLLPVSVTWNHKKTGFEPPQQQWMAHPKVLDRIRVSKEILVKKQYLHPSVLSKNIQPSPAYAAENKDWRYLVAGILVE